MQDKILEVIGGAVQQTANSRPEHLHDLALELAKFTTSHTVNDDGSRLRETGYILSGAIMDWLMQLYPEYDTSLPPIGSE